MVCVCARARAPPGHLNARAHTSQRLDGINEDGGDTLKKRLARFHGPGGKRDMFDSSDDSETAPRRLKFNRKDDPAIPP